MAFPQPTAPEPSARDVEPLPTLAALAPGTRGVVVRVEDGDRAGQRLLDLGFTPGTRFTVLRRAPLGDPVLYELRGARHALRRSEARRIRVMPE